MVHEAKSIFKYNSDANTCTKRWPHGLIQTLSLLTDFQHSKILFIGLSVCYLWEKLYSPSFRVV